MPVGRRCWKNINREEEGGIAKDQPQRLKMYHMRACKRRGEASESDECSGELLLQVSNVALEFMMILISYSDRK